MWSKADMRGSDYGHEYLEIHTWETKGRPLMAHQCDCYVEARKTECEEIELFIYFHYLFLLFVLYSQHSIIKTYIMKVKDTLLSTLI